MRRLRAQARKGPLPRRGRPPIAQSERTRVRGLVEEEWLRQGRTTGARPILRKLRAVEPGISKQLVEEALAELKAEAETKVELAREVAREGHVVLGRDTVWAEDTTHLGRLPSGEESAGEHIKDRGTWFTVSLTVGARAHGRDVLHDLSARRRSAGLPLVPVRQRHDLPRQDRAGLLAEERVIVLLSRVHTRRTTRRSSTGTAGEGRCGLGGRGTRVPRPGAGAARPAVGSSTTRLQPNRGWHTAAGSTACCRVATVRGPEAVLRERTRAAMEAAVSASKTPPRRGLAEREAVITALCEAGLARRPLGPDPSDRSPCPFSHCPLATRARKARIGPCSTVETTNTTADAPRRTTRSCRPRRGRIFRHLAGQQCCYDRIRLAVTGEQAGTDTGRGASERKA
jgi:hypothetical protein